MTILLYTAGLCCYNVDILKKLRRMKIENKNKLLIKVNFKTCLPVNSYPDWIVLIYYFEY